MIGTEEPRICSHWVSLGFPLGRPGDPQNTWLVSKERAAVPCTPEVCADPWCSPQSCTAVPGSPAHRGSEGLRPLDPSRPLTEAGTRKAGLKTTCPQGHDQDEPLLSETQHPRLQQGPRPPSLHLRVHPSVHGSPTPVSLWGLPPGEGGHVPLQAGRGRWINTFSFLKRTLL